mmetsp:Transcript_4692/g.13888  ORF Transcript_4692/g.13888 Transcript_4692/m.13888 type:complete len:581 (+) Transcript_4692:70-1812(+)
MMDAYYNASLEPPEMPYRILRWDTERHVGIDDFTVRLTGHGQVVMPGTQYWTNSSGVVLGTASFFVLPELVSRKEVKVMRALLERSTPDTDPDSVDGRSTLELVLERNGSLDQAGLLPGKAEDGNVTAAHERRLLRARVGGIARKIVNERITPFVRSQFPLQRKERSYTLCHSFIRRYLPGQRRSHALHMDLMSRVSVVVSLSDFGVEHLSGLHLQASGESKAQTLPLARGDAVVHESDLQHGVHLPETGTRWSWVLWYQDSATCHYHGEEWHAKCAEDGSALCQHLQSHRTESLRVQWARRVGKGRKESGKEVAEDLARQAEAANWARRAAEGGLGLAMHHYALLLKQGKGVPKDVKAAANWLRRAIDASNEPHAHCQLGDMLITGNATPISADRSATEEAAAHYRAAAAGGLQRCHANVGFLHLGGAEGAVKDKELALRWFERADTKQAMLEAAQIHADSGRYDKAEHWVLRAHNAGEPNLLQHIAALRTVQEPPEPAQTRAPTRKRTPTESAATPPSNMRTQSHTVSAGGAVLPGWSDQGEDRRPASPPPPLATRPPLPRRLPPPSPPGMGGGRGGA